MSTGGKVCAETASAREKLSRPAKNETATQQHLAKLLATPNSTKLHSPSAKLVAVKVESSAVKKSVTVEVGAAVGRRDAKMETALRAENSRRLNLPREQDDCVDKKGLV